MDDYIPLHICDDLFPRDIPMGSLQNRIVISQVIDNQEILTIVRNPSYVMGNYYR